MINGVEPAPLVHNKTRGAILVAGSIFAIAMAAGGCYTPLWSTTLFLPNYGLGNGGQPFEIDTDVYLTKSCVTLDNGPQHCQDNSEIPCDALKKNFMIMKNAYYSAAGFLVLGLIMGGLDFAGVMKKRIVHCIILGMAALGSLTAFIMVIQTMNGTFCNIELLNSQAVNTMNASPFLIAAAGCAAVTGAIIALVAKDKPAPAPASDYLNAQPQQGMVYAQPQQGVAYTQVPQGAVYEQQQQQQPPQQQPVVYTQPQPKAV